MAGVVQLWGRSGASPGSTGHLNAHVHYTDEDSLTSKASTSPIQKPSSPTATAYSFERYIYFKCAVAPDNLMSNFRIWSPVTSSPATGIVYKIGTTNSYADPVASKSTKAMRLFHSTYNTYATGLRLYQGLSNVGDVTNYVVVQVNVTSAAASGNADSNRTIINVAWDSS